MSATPRPPCYGDLDYLGAASAYVEEVFEVLSQGVLFEQFARNEIEALCGFMHCFAVPRGATVLHEGQEGDHMVVVLSGEVEVSKRGPDGISVSLATVAPGASLGEMSLFDGKKRFATCVATRPTDFAVMTRDDFNEFLSSYPWLANKLLIRLMQIMSERVRLTGTRLMNDACIRMG